MSPPTRDAKTIPIRHLLQVPGKSPISFDGPDWPGSDTCDHCGVVADDEGDLTHDAECDLARKIVAREHRDITTDGAGEFTSALRLHLARQFADEQLGIKTDLTDPDVEAIAPEVARRHADLVAGYDAGYHQAQQSARELVRVELAKLSSRVDTWSGTGADGDGDGDEEKPRGE